MLESHLCIYLLLCDHATAELTNHSHAALQLALGTLTSPELLLVFCFVLCCFNRLSLLEQF